MRILPVILLILLFACNETAVESEVDSIPDSMIDTISSDSPNPHENAGIDLPGNYRREALPEGEWYGIDSDEDTVIYEKDGKILTSGSVTGTFEMIERGDFLHYVIRDSNSFLHSFFIAIDDRDRVDRYYGGDQPEKGRRVTVKWIRGPFVVSDGGATITAYQAIGIME
jgi:hypothetical protein